MSIFKPETAEDRMAAAFLTLAVIVTAVGAGVIFGAIKVIQSFL